MSAEKQIKAVARDRAGKGAARAVRREGRVPAVIYGGGEAPQMISLDYNETKRLIFAGHFLTTVFEIDVDGKTSRAIPRDYQLDPVKDLPVHVDFLRLAKGGTIRVTVPVHVVDYEASPGVKAGATVQIVEHALELTVPSDAIPDSIEVSVAGLEIGSSVHIADITLPAGCKPVTNENLTLLSVLAPTVSTETTEEVVEPAKA
jgi:large subunit ribosomal protein L25